MDKIGKAHIALLAIAVAALFFTIGAGFQMETDYFKKVDQDTKASIVVTAEIDTSALEEAGYINPLDDPDHDCLPTTQYYYPYTSDEIFEREMIEKLVEVLQDSKGEFFYEQNAAGLETIKVKITWGK